MGFRITQSVSPLRITEPRREPLKVLRTSLQSVPMTVEFLTDLYFLDRRSKECEIRPLPITVLRTKRDNVDSY